MGTTSIKAVLYDPDERPGRADRHPAYPGQHPRPDWSEHNPQELWQATADCIREAAAGQPVTGLAISSMAEAGLLIDSEARPVSPMIAWYDRRSEPQAAQDREASSR